MNILGISGGFHDAAATVIDSSGNILLLAMQNAIVNARAMLTLALHC